MIRVRATDNFLMSYIHFDILAYQIVNCIEISRGQFKIKTYNYLAEFI